MIATVVPFEPGTSWGRKAEGKGYNTTCCRALYSCSSRVAGRCRCGERRVAFGRAHSAAGVGHARPAVQLNERPAAGLNERPAQYNGFLRQRFWPG